VCRWRERLLPAMAGLSARSITIGVIGARLPVAKYVELAQDGPKWPLKVRLVRERKFINRMPSRRPRRVAILIATLIALSAAFWGVTAFQCMTQAWFLSQAPTCTYEVQWYLGHWTP
jgi:hypothetical protein